MKAKGGSGDRGAPQTVCSHLPPPWAAWYPAGQAHQTGPKSRAPGPCAQASETLGGWLGHKGWRQPGKTTGVESHTGPLAHFIPGMNEKEETPR